MTFLANFEKELCEIAAKYSCILLKYINYMAKEMMQFFVYIRTKNSSGSRSYTPRVVFCLGRV
jgi:hypothetical protein